MSSPWKSDQYFVSPLNYDAEVRKGMKLPAKVKVHDITLRDGEQETGVALCKDDKVEIAEKLAEVGVHRIETGMPAVTKDDEAAIREIVKRNLGPEIFAFSRCMIDDIKLAVDCGVQGVIVEIPSSEEVIKYAYKWPLEKSIDQSVKATQYAHESGLYVNFFTIDATRADFNFLIQLVQKVAEEGHMDSLTLVDTMGCAHPSAIRHYVREIKKVIHKPLEAHFHNDFGLANANTLAAVEEGAEVVHSTVLGIGERGGQASTEQLILALELLYGYDTGIKLDKLYDLGMLVANLTGHVVPVNQPLLGSRYFELESGIPSSWWVQVMNSHPTVVFPMLPSLVGAPDVNLVLGKSSGSDSVRYWLSKIGVQMDEDQILRVLTAVKTKSIENKGLINLQEFETIVNKIK